MHGLGGAAVNWSAIAPLLTGQYRLLAPDLSGHGLTWSARRGTGVRAQRVLLDGFLAAVATGPVILMGNSMGGMLSLLEAAAAPKAVAGLILIDPVLPVVLARLDPIVAGLFASAAVPGLGRLISRRRLPPEAIVAAALALCCADPARVAPEVVARHVYVAKQRAEIAGADRDFLSATRSLAATVFPGRGRAFRRAVNSIELPGAAGARRPGPAGAGEAGPGGRASSPGVVGDRAIRRRPCADAGDAARDGPADHRVDPGRLAATLRLPPVTTGKRLRGSVRRRRERPVSAAYGRRGAAAVSGWIRGDVTQPSG